MKKIFIFFTGIAIFFFLCSPQTHAINMVIGDVDGFGFGDGSSYIGAYGGSTDINNNGILDAGDVLPDLNRNGRISTGGGDNFDNRSFAETSNGSGAQWTDISLARSYRTISGLARDASFTFQFDVPTLGAFDYGLDHSVSLVYADYDIPTMYADVDGERLSLKGNRYGGYDGFIWQASVTVSWESMLDGILTIDIIAPREPYVAFDYVKLWADTGNQTLGAEPTNTAPVPEPATMLLLGVGLAGFGFVGYRRKRKK